MEKKKGEECLCGRYLEDTCYDNGNARALGDLFSSSIKDIQI